MSDDPIGPEALATLAVAAIPDDERQADPPSLAPARARWRRRRRRSRTARAVLAVAVVALGLLLVRSRDETRLQTVAPVSTAPATTTTIIPTTTTGPPRWSGNT
jgi:hypothetical protein